MSRRRNPQSIGPRHRPSVESKPCGSVNDSDGSSARHSSIGPSRTRAQPRGPNKPLSGDDTPRAYPVSRPAPEGTRPHRGPGPSRPAVGVREVDPTRAAYDVAATFFDEGRGAAARWMGQPQARLPAGPEALIAIARQWLQLLSPTSGEPATRRPAQRYAPAEHEAAVGHRGERPVDETNGRPWYYVDHQGQPDTRANNQSGSPKPSGQRRRAYAPATQTNPSENKLSYDGREDESDGPTLPEENKILGPDGWGDGPEELPPFY